MLAPHAFFAPHLVGELPAALDLVDFRLPAHGRMSLTSHCLIVDNPPMPFEKFIDEHERRKAKALAMGGRDRLDKQAAMGRLNARQRIDRLFDPGTFAEIGM